MKNYNFLVGYTNFFTALYRATLSSKHSTRSLYPPSTHVLGGGTDRQADEQTDRTEYSKGFCI